MSSSNTSVTIHHSSAFTSKNKYLQVEAATDLRASGGVGVGQVSLTVMKRRVSSILDAISRYLDPSGVFCTKSMFQALSLFMSAKPPDENARRRLIVWWRVCATHKEEVLGEEGRDTV